MMHQLGSFPSAYRGRLLYDALSSYTMAWRIGVALVRLDSAHPAGVEGRVALLVRCAPGNTRKD